MSEEHDNVIDAIKHWTDPTVDIAAILSIAVVVYAQPDGALAQISIGAIASVALGKRYMARQ